jgi:hypothetical protein
LTVLPDLLGDLVTDTLGQVHLDVLAGNPRVAEQVDLARYLFFGLLLVGIGGEYVWGLLTDRISPGQGLVAVLALLTVTALAFGPIATTGILGTRFVAAVLGFCSLRDAAPEPGDDSQVLLPGVPRAVLRLYLSGDFRGRGTRVRDHRPVLT